MRLIKMLLPALLLTSIVVTAQELDKTKELEALVVKGNIPYLKLDNGAISFNPKTIISKRAVSNAYDLLGYIPGLSITDGSPKLLGIYPAVILLNNQNTGASAEQIFLYLQSLAPESIKSVELMPIAPSHTGVQGAAINITIDATKGTQGVSSLITATGELGKYKSGGLRAGINAVSARWDNNLSVALGATNSGSETETHNRHTLLGSGVIPVLHKTHTYVEHKQYSVQLNSAYKIDDNNRLSFMGYLVGKGRDSHNDASVLINNTAPDYKTGVVTDAKERLYHLNVGYSNPKISNINLSYAHYLGDRDVSMQSLSAPLGANNLQMYHGSSDQDYKSIAYNINRTSQLGKALSLTYGIYGNHHTTSSNNRTVESLGATLAESLVQNKEYEHNVHALLAYALSPKLSMSLGATISQFHRNKTKLSDEISETNILPNLQLSYMPSSKHIYVLSMQAKRTYPSYDELSSIQLSRNVYSTYIGNPYLRPSLSYTANLQYVLNQKYSFSLWATHTREPRITMPYQLSDRLMSVYKPLNLDYETMAGFTFATSVDVGSIPGLSLSGNLSAVYYHQRMRDFYTLDINKKKVYFVGNLRAEYSLPGAKNFRLGFDAIGNTESIQGVYKIKSMWRIDPWIHYTFWGGRATLSVSFVDLFDTYRPRTLIEELGQYEEMKQWNFLRRLKVELTYRISRKKYEDKLPAPDIERYMQRKSD